MKVGQKETYCKQHNPKKRVMTIQEPLNKNCSRSAHRYWLSCDKTISETFAYEQTHSCPYPKSSPKLEITIVEEDPLFQWNSVYLPWPDRILNLNHIEHIWDTIGRKVHERTPQFKHVMK